jgi:hypothetical protein
MHHSWRKEYERLVENPNRYRHLDAAQLVKHYLGLKHTFPDRSIVLAYLYWEPLNAPDLPPCRIHRAEVETFARQLNDPQLEFKPMPYSKLWSQWKKRLELSKHVEALRRRYDVEVPAAS